ncbi:hypothetical protein [Ureibacillus sinduriensis]|uniref:Uncharacterized protein n=1 Tax=Ureibacillus sinduriensis BLB-1 = JCM 15800 TaxID=1384057 RepID=A0A0A3HX03_9BACL|nr:hypothetical protein [Ureibacillus sinduriensis]KGR74883.1 hypothetical protein CD33_14080 [Ureibacillus sinduriensis BLB-1 = JCM 15800]
MFKNWTNRDWFWLSSYFIFIVILLLANFYLEWETNLSIISSATSIALAILAIFLSLKQDSENKISSDTKHLDLSKQLRELSLSIINKQDGITEVLNNVEKSVDTNNELEEKQENYTHEQLLEYGEKVKKETIQKFEKELNKQMLKNYEDLDRIQKGFTNSGKRDPKEIIKNYIESVSHYTIEDVQFHLRGYGIEMSTRAIKVILNMIKKEVNNKFEL